MSSFQQVHLTLKEHAKNRIVERTIDISNLINWSTGYVATNPEVQRELLQEWIEDRGVDQHDSELSLISWSVH